MAAYYVTYGNHDMGSPGGSMVRETLELAKRAARLMRECGYRDVSIRRRKTRDEVLAAAYRKAAKATFCRHKANA